MHSFYHKNELLIYLQKKKERKDFAFGFGVHYFSIVGTLRGVITPDQGGHGHKISSEFVPHSSEPPNSQSETL